MTLGLYVIYILLMGLSGVVSTHFGWLLISVAATVAYVTTTMMDTNLMVAKRALVSGIGVVVLMTLCVAGILYMKQGAPSMIDVLASLGLGAVSLIKKRLIKCKFY